MGWFSRRTLNDEALANDIGNFIGILEDASEEYKKGNNGKASSLITTLLSYMLESMRDRGLSRGIPKELNDKIYEPLLLLSLQLEKKKYFDLKLFKSIIKNFKRLRRAL